MRAYCKCRILFPMMLSDNDLRTFIAAYEVDFHKTISLNEAGEMARRVLAFFDLLATEPDQDKGAQAL